MNPTKGDAKKCNSDFLNRYSKERSFRMRFFGEDMGLVLLLSAPKEDTFYKAFSLDGFIVS